MALSPEIAFRNIAPSQDAEAEIRQQVEKLSIHFARMTHCRVTVEALHQHHRTGNLLEVHVVMEVPGTELAVSHAPHHARERWANPDMIICIKEAFKLAERRLETHKGHLRQNVKLPENMDKDVVE